MIMNINEQIVLGLKKREEETFDFVYQAYAGLVHHVILFIIRDTAYAEDLTQETFIHLMNHTEDLDASRNLKFYLLQIAKNLALDYVKSKRPELVANEMDEIPSDEPLLTEDNKFNSLMNRYRQYINASEYDILILHLYFNLPFSEIATLKNKTQRAVEGIYGRAVAKLKKRARKEDFNE